MKRRLVLMMTTMILAATLAACSSVSESERAATARSSQQASRAGQPVASKQGAAAGQSAGHAAAPDGHDGHSHGDAGRVPAFQADKASLKSLSPTLDPQKFSGRQKLAYAAVQEIPETIAQLPCYCYCDEGFGHKSLHSCFVDDHAAHCAVCVDEALLAYKLQKEEQQTPEQIRERVIAQFSR